MIRRPPRSPLFPFTALFGSLVGEGASPVAVAGAGLVALVGRRAAEGRAAAGPRRADVVLGAGVVVVTGSAVGLVGEGASPVAVASAGLVDRKSVVSGESVALAGRRITDNNLGARVAVVTGSAVGLVGEGASRMAVEGAGLWLLFGRGVAEARAAAGPRRADVVLGARVAVVTGSAVGLVGEGASPVAVASAGLVALVGRRAAEGRAAAGPRRTEIGRAACRASVSISVVAVSLKRARPVAG